MNEFEKKQKLDAFKKKLLLASKKEIIDLLVKEIQEHAETKEFLREGFAKEVERTKRHENQLEKICSAAAKNAKILEKVHALLDDVGLIYPDMSLENCIQGLILDVEMSRESNNDVETRKTESSAD